MRTDAAVSLIFLVAGVAATLAVSQDTAAPPRNSRSSITSVSVAETGNGVDVEVAFSHLVQPEVSRLEHPDRLIFDFPGCGLAGPGQRFVVNRGPVIAVRSEPAGPAVSARVIVELRSEPKSAQDRERALSGNKLVVNLGSAGNNLLIELGTNGGAPHPASASAGSKPAANSQPLAPKSEDALPSTPTAPPLVLRSDRLALSSTAPPPKPKVLPPPAHILPAATTQVDAYALLDQARALGLADLEALEAKAQAGDPQSETTLALAYHAGTLLKLDDAEALRLLRQAAGRGFVPAEEALAIFCQSGFGMPPDKKQAVSWYTRAAEHGSKDAATNLGLMYSTGDGIPKDPEQAASWFRGAAEAGDATAQVNLAGLYHRGEGVPQDDTQAALWLTKAAEQGLLPAMLELATWDLSPEHGGHIGDAIRWLKKAGDLGNATAQMELGDIFADKKFGRQDYSQAVDWYRKAAEQGQREGQFGLGARYFFGQGVLQDFDEARNWLTRAANQGHPYAQFLLAKMFESGEGGPVDVASAEKYYDPAANFGIPEAQYHLGLLLASDRSNGANLVSAYKWLVLAEDPVKESAATAQQLRKLLAPAQIAQAEHEIDEWRTAHPPRRSDR
jgi:TPR repeat protein